MRTRAAFSLTEAVVASCIALTLIVALVQARYSARATNELTAHYLSLLENVSMASHLLRADARQLIVLPGLPVDPYSLKIAADRRSIRLRHGSLQARSGGVPVPTAGYVDYFLVPAGRDVSHLVRREWVSGATYQDKVFRSFTLRDACFILKEDEAKDLHILHIGLEVVSDNGAVTNWGPFRNKTMYLTAAINLIRPEPGSPPFADRLDGIAEEPPEDVAALDLPPPSPVVEHE